MSNNGYTELEVETYNLHARLHKSSIPPGRHHFIGRVGPHRGHGDQPDLVVRLEDTQP
jgi:hypothetical protein